MENNLWAYKYWFNFLSLSKKRNILLVRQSLGETPNSWYLRERRFSNEERDRSEGFLSRSPLFLSSIDMTCVRGEEGVSAWTMDQISIKTTNPKCRPFLKNWPVKVLGSRCLSVWGSRSPPPPRYTLYEYIPLPLYSHREGGGVGEPVRRLEGR